MRTYEKTHPWLSFCVSLKDAPPVFWIMLGECHSKCEHLGNAPLRPSVARELHQVFLAKGVQATTAIEGNTLSEEQVLQHLKGELTLPPSQEYLQQEIDNILQACNEATEALAAENAPVLSSERIKHLNNRVLNALEVGEGVVPGALRTYSVTVGNVYRGAPAEDCEYLLDRLCQWLNGPDFSPPDSMSEYGPIFAILRAIIAHLYLAWIHPFGDGNGRTALLVEFEILLSSGLPSPATNLLSSHYNATRTEYYRQLDLASKSDGGAVAFLHYAVQGFLDGLRGYVQRVWEQQYDVVWRSYVHEKFRDRAGEVHARRRHLVLDLSTTPKPKTKTEIATLTPRLAAAYARKTDKTLSRDLNALVEMGLIAKTADRYRARKEVVMEFLPTQARDSRTE